MEINSEKQFQRGCQNPPSELNLRMTGMNANINKGTRMLYKIYTYRKKKVALLKQRREYTTGRGQA